MSNRSKLLLRTLLLTLVFATQGLCHAHQVDHFANSDNTPCSVCSASSQLEDAVPGNCAVPPVNSAGQEPVALPLSPQAQLDGRLATARSPPLYR